jgi:hypothetical protein
MPSFPSTLAQAMGHDTYLEARELVQACLVSGAGPWQATVAAHLRSPQREAFLEHYLKELNDHTLSTALGEDDVPAAAVGFAHATAMLNPVDFQRAASALRDTLMNRAGMLFRQPEGDRLSTAVQEQILAGLQAGHDLSDRQMDQAQATFAPVMVTPAARRGCRAGPR